jgi:hypothetical protein
MFDGTLLSQRDTAYDFLSHATNELLAGNKSPKMLESFQRFEALAYFEKRYKEPGTLTALFEETMALNEQDRAWIRETVREALREHAQAHGWRRAVKVLREWSAPSITVGILLFVLTQWSQYIEFRAHANDRLDNIDAKLRTLEVSQSPRKVLQEIETLDQKTFAKNLPALRKVAEQQPVGIDPSFLREVAQKLQRTNEDAPDYWPTVLQFIQFASANVSPDVPPPGEPNITLAENSLDLAAFGGKVSNKRILLDGGELSNGVFEKCRIKFTNKPVAMRNITFRDCVFEFPATENPDPSLKRTGQLLLSSDLRLISIRAL